MSGPTSALGFLRPEEWAILHRDTNKILVRSIEIAQVRYHSIVTTCHLLYAITQERSPAAYFLRYRRIDAATVEQDQMLQALVGSRRDQSPEASLNFERVVRRAITETLQSHQQFVLPEHLLLAIVLEGGEARALLRKCNLTSEILVQQIRGMLVPPIVKN